MLNVNSNAAGQPLVKPALNLTSNPSGNAWVGDLTLVDIFECEAD